MISHQLGRSGSKSNTQELPPDIELRPYRVPTDGDRREACPSLPARPSAAKILTEKTGSFRDHSRSGGGTPDKQPFWRPPGSYGHSEIKTQPGSQTDDSLLKVPVASYGNLGSSLAPESYLGFSPLGPGASRDPPSFRSNVTSGGLSRDDCSLRSYEELTEQETGRSQMSAKPAAF
ncbi:hypothetical protein NliqN6_3503 [Naganishia liquefaciens]|uniref:Uncharacterized protein n=1 Tax=Naganishia liquefaciens TaxID=104408 RepID=A0A8H3YGX5_9TREE|nr:hypothetical protein NliqN6_3503 [Naganishia liquefaciens]